MCATVSFVSVHSPTCAPRRAAAYAASHPACPAPTTITSKLFFTRHNPEKTAENSKYAKKMIFSAIFASSAVFSSSSFADAELRENVLEQFFRRSSSADLFECRARIRQVREDEFLRQRSAFRTGRR